MLGGVLQKTTLSPVRSSFQPRVVGDTRADIAHSLELSSTNRHSGAEMFGGYGVMGVPFASGHYLALRRFPSSSIGPAFSSVWWRQPSGTWTIFTDGVPELSCPRYIGSAVDCVETREIQLTWRTAWSLNVLVCGRLEWQLELSQTPLTAMMTRLGSSMPDALWRNPIALGLMGASRASIDSVDVGPIGPIAHQLRLADVWLPQTGLFFAGQVRFTA